jgi:endonuclease YncB( thermonuclease family)
MKPAIGSIEHMRAMLRSPKELFEARFLRARDGDTIEVLGNIGFGIHLEMAIRIAEIESYEPEGNTRRDAELAAARVENLLRGTILTVQPVQRRWDKYGRLVARVCYGSKDVGELLVTNGIAWQVAPTHTHTAKNPPVQKPRVETATTTENVAAAAS